SNCLMKSILVIEDDIIMCNILQLILKKQGYIVSIAQNGQEALSLLKKGHFDLIVTDLMLPFANGLELVSKLKASASQNKIPVIILSAVTDERTVREAFDLGADDYLKKPFAPSELVSRIHRLLTKQKITL
ncbi:MAG TPA: response regulator transcription factor, partial [Chitinophaga sp.]